jgi:glucosamine--fructose-6-phosphate aminotransferase (isomerizing)
MTNGIYTRNEIEQQSKAWTETLAGFSRQERTLVDALAGMGKEPWLVIGCGSTYYASLGAAAMLRRFGIASWAFPSSEIVYFDDLLPPGEMHLLAISRSGTTTETQWAVERFRKKFPRSKVVSITTQPESPLARGSDLILSAEAAREQSVAQTRSFTSMFILSQCLAGVLAGDPGLVGRLEKLPPALDRLVGQTSNLARQLGEDRSLQRFFFLGAGPNYGLACEAMLKTKEMTRSWAEAFHPLEFRHGPMSVVDEQSLVTCFVSDSEQEAETRLVRNMKKLGARILVLTEDASRTDWNGIEYVVELRSGLNEWERGALNLPFIHWMDFHRTLAKGLDPDQPTNLTAVVELE